MIERKSYLLLLIVGADYYLYNGDVSVSKRMYQPCQILVAYRVSAEPGTSKVQSVVRTAKRLCSPQLRPEHAVRLSSIHICTLSKR